MRKVFTETVNDPRVSAQEGTFDTTGIEDGWADLVVIAQVRIPAFRPVCPRVRVLTECFST